MRQKFSCSKREYQIIFIHLDAICMHFELLIILYKNTFLVDGQVVLLQSAAQEGILTALLPFLFFPPLTALGS